MTQIDSRRLQRRNNLRQVVADNQLMQHSHSFWEEVNYTLFASNITYNSLTPTALGCRIYLNPVVLMYSVKAELILTTTFAGGGDSYTAVLWVGSTPYSYHFTTAVTYQNSVTDITFPIKVFFEEFTEKEAYVTMEVSNAATPVELYGAQLRFTVYGEDNYGDYANAIQPLLIDKSNVEKSYIKLMDKQAQGFTYLSGIEPR
jgi:hypothetical protein